MRGAGSPVVYIIFTAAGEINRFQKFYNPELKEETKNPLS